MHIFVFSNNNYRISVALSLQVGKSGELVLGIAIWWWTWNQWQPTPTHSKKKYILQKKELNIHCFSSACITISANCQLLISLIEADWKENCLCSSWDIMFCNQNCAVSQSLEAYRRWADLAICAHRDLLPGAGDKIRWNSTPCRGMTSKDSECTPFILHHQTWKEIWTNIRIVQNESYMSLNSSLMLILFYYFTSHPHIVLFNNEAQRVKLNIGTLRKHSDFSLLKD